MVDKVNLKSFRDTAPTLREVLISNKYSEILRIPTRKLSFYRGSFYSNAQKEHRQKHRLLPILYMPFEISNILGFLFSKEQLFKSSIFPDLYKDVFCLLNPNTAILFKFFFLLEPLEREVLETIIPDKVITRLIDANILEQKKKIRSNFAITPINGSFIFERKDLRSMGLSAYIMKNEIQDYIKNSDEYLDVCTGTGVYPTLFHANFGSCICTDIDKRCLEVVELNKIFNKAKNIRTRLSDCLKNVNGYFDLITANPPFGFVPKEYGWDHIIDGGELGIEISKNILKDLDDHLKMNGRFIMITTGPVINNKNRLVEYLKRKFKDDYEIKTKIIADLNFVDLIKFYEKYNIQSLQYMIINIKKSNKSEIEIKNLNILENATFSILRKVIRLESLFLEEGE